MYTYSFEKLELWKESKEFTKSIYILTSTFPDSEKYGLVLQLIKSSFSIFYTIAEGSERNSFKDQAHFTTMAFSATVEVLNQLILSFELNFIDQKDYYKLRQDIESITTKLNALRNYQVKNSK